MYILGFIVILVVAAVCAAIAERLVPNKVPGGFATSAVVGLLGAWVGGSLIGHMGPDFAGVSLINCILGSAILVFVVSLVARYIPRSAQ